jgi:hypothetical protein
MDRPGKRHQPLYIFDFLISLLNIEKTQSSEPLRTKLNQTSCLFGSRFAQNLFFLLAGALLFDEKIRQKCCTTLAWIAGC